MELMKKLFFVVLLCFSLLGMLVFSFNQVQADTVTTSVVVGNTAPSLTAGPAESTASDDTTPTNVGDSITFEATATDSNNEDYYLIVCKTNAVTATNGGAPTCDVAQWCVSSATNSGSQATCDYTVTTGETLESYDWYAFVCDGNSSSATCSSSDQGSGSTGSPFKVNHAPTFNVVSNDGPKNPGESVTWSTNALTIDADTSGSADTVKLIVCKTAGISGGDCDGGASDRWCQSSLVANNPSCSYTLPSPNTSGSNDAYVYVVDNHNFASTDALNGSQSDFTVSNTNPVVSNVVINSGSDINLNESTTFNVVVTADVTDTNGCGGGEITGVVADLYRSGTTATGCDTNGEDDYDNCYAVESCSETSCTGSGASYSCTIAVQYHADPTDTNTEYPTENWLATVTADDQSAGSGSFESSAGVEMNSLTAMDVGASIDYGTLSVGTNTGNLAETLTVTATGNVGVDNQLSGTDMTDGGESIGVAQQKYDLSAVLYSLATALSTSATEVETNVGKTTAAGTTTTPATGDIYWGIEIPGGTVAGSYAGTNTVTVVKGEVAGW